MILTNEHHVQHPQYITFVSMLSAISFRRSDLDPGKPYQVPESVSLLLTRSRSSGAKVVVALGVVGARVVVLLVLGR